MLSLYDDSMLNMIPVIYEKSEQIYNRLSRIWFSEQAHLWMSRILAFSFIVSLILGALIYNKIIPETEKFYIFRNPFAAIEIAFTLLLVTELFSLIFELPVSIAKSIGKQYELLSLIFIRFAFKEFSHIHGFEWGDEMKNTLMVMFAYAFGSVIIFALIALLYRIQKQFKVYEVFIEDRYFIRFRKFLSLLLLFSLFYIVIKDMYAFLFLQADHLFSFHEFFSFLIFSDILILLISIRYSLDYHSMYKYSGYILGTILIRVALLAEPFWNVVIGIISAVYIIFLTWTYKYMLHGTYGKKTVRLYYYPKTKKFKPYKK